MRYLPLVLLLALTACPAHKGPATTTDPVGNDGGKGAPHELMATLERTACYGWCPVYSVSVYRDGAVEYVGEQYVKTVGKASGHLAPDKIEELAKLFADNGYFDLKDAYTNYEMTDAPSSSTSFHDGTRAKEIDHYHGDSSAPAALVTVEDGIDRIVDIDQWIGTEAEREQLAGH